MFLVRAAYAKKRMGSDRFPPPSPTLVDRARRLRGSVICVDRLAPVVGKVVTSHKHKEWIAGLGRITGHYSLAAFAHRLSRSGLGNCHYQKLTSFSHSEKIFLALRVRRAIMANGKPKQVEAYGTSFCFAI
jgi:hypothetical protein